MRLGIDFDGTVADTTEAKVRYALERFGERVTGLETTGPHGAERLGHERYLEMVEAVHRTEWTLSIAPMPGAIEALHALAEHHELFIVTARTHEEIGWAREWLRPHGVPFRGVVHTNREPKDAACDTLGIDVMLDDSLYVLRQLEGVGAHLALMDAEYNRAGDYPVRTRRVIDWSAFIDLVATTERDASAVSRPRRPDSPAPVRR
ncbi:MAG: hypothetical protein R3C39_06570 [Dehalococcoidia bacterium]